MVSRSAQLSGISRHLTIGRLRPCPVLDLRFVVLGHNTVRGAAGQGVQIAELLVADERHG